MPNSTTPLVAILAYDQLCTFEFACAVEIFALARPEILTDWYRCVVVAAEPGPLRGMGGVEVRADGGLDLLETASTIVIPGWRGPDGAIPPGVLEALCRAHERGCRLVSICAGAFVLAAAGLLAGRRATTHWHYCEKLAAYPDVIVEPGVLYVDDGSVLTSAGSAAGLDLCLHIVRKDFGAKVASRVARRLVISLHREGGQAQFIERSVPQGSGTRLATLLDLIRSRLDETWSIERMASEAGVSIRSLHRYFQSATGAAPGMWLISERVSQARVALEETSMSVEEIAAHVGFGSAPILRSHFKRIVGLTPTAYRLLFETTA